jgi:hypothetical protein
MTTTMGTMGTMMMMMMTTTGTMGTTTAMMMGIMMMGFYRVLFDVLLYSDQWKCGNAGGTEMMMMMMTVMMGTTMTMEMAMSKMISFCNTYHSSTDSSQNLQNPLESNRNIGILLEWTGFQPEFNADAQFGCRWAPYTFRGFCSGAILSRGIPAFWWNLNSVQKFHQNFSINLAGPSAKFDSSGILGIAQILLESVEDNKDLSFCRVLY